MADFTSVTDSDVIREAQRGNRAAFDELVYRYDKQVLSIAARYVNQADDAKDIYQEVFMRVYRGLKKFQARSEFSTWLYRITMNVCYTHGSRRQKHARHVQDRDIEGTDSEDHGALGVSEHGSDQHTLNMEISSRVQKALETLSAQQKLVFTLKHYEGYKLREIAVMADISEGTAKKHLFVATQRLREQLKDLY
ncbi:MAG TPA: sigma-70 family RNA polymerase sigma factor [Bacteroidota bacterium]|nr:sigma-70 family RNA polymerase sigma factor [Bacteroidota bacterium]